MKKLIVVGGGFAGSTIAKSLENEFDTILIDTKDYFEFTPGILRTIVEPGHIKKIQVLHSTYLKKAKFIRILVKVVNHNEIILENDKKLFFDYLAICSGSNYNDIFKQENVVVAIRADALRECHSKLRESKKVLIIGGGLVGVELAAEIIDCYKDKDIVLVHSKGCIIDRNHRKASRLAEEFLRGRGIKIMVDERLVESKGDNFTTNKGTEIKADMAFLCTGIKPNCEFFKVSFPDKIDEKSQIKVNEHLQVEGFTNIFASGDIASVNEEKTAQNAEKQAKIVVKNIRSLERNEKLHSYKSKARIMIISLGKRNGIFAYKNINFSGFVPAIMKWLIERMVMLKYR